MGFESSYAPVRTAVTVLAIAVALLALLPLLAATVLLARVLIVFALIASAVAMVVHPKLRTWIFGPDARSAMYKGMRIPTREWMHVAHSWARPDGNSNMLVGIDDIAASSLGAADGVQLPLVGDHVEQGAPLAQVRSGDRELTMRSPLSGTVVAVNELLAANPSLLNDAPYGVGWTARLTCDDARKERRSLRKGHGARQWFTHEVDRLIGEISGTEQGLAVAADGGQVVDDIAGSIDDLAWQRLREKFFGDL